MESCPAWLLKVLRVGLALALVLTAMGTSAYADQSPFGSPVPEIDPGSLGSALTLLIGGAFLITGGKSRKA